MIKVPKMDEKSTIPTRANLFIGNRSAENGMLLSYVPPEIVGGNIVVTLD